jgi:glycosyltransferase involved in cell wall biosynthesis
MKPYISIICPTTRVGGLDLLFTTLQNQSFQDFELLLVDSLYYNRKDLVKEKSPEYTFKVKHLTQLETATDLCKCINNALIHCDGTVVYFLPDYTWLKDDCLQMHADFHKSKDPIDNYAFIGHFNDCKLPTLHKDFYRTYANDIPFYREATDRAFENGERLKFNNYLDDVNSGKLDSLMWSLFEKPITDDNYPKSFEIMVQKKILSEGFVDSRQCVLKNESYLLETLFNINGLNERLDGSHGWQDLDLLDRLIAKTNIKLYHNPQAIAYTFNPREIMYARYRRREVFSNEKVWKDDVSSNFKETINNWSLKEAKDNLQNIKVIKSQINNNYKPYISIITPMMRPGSMDVVFNSLERQIFKDFELIIVDSLYHYRKDIVKEYSKKFSFKFKYLPTIIDRFPTQSYCHAMNSAITNVNGEVILFTSDFRYFMPDTLQKHADFHKSHSDNIGYAPPSKFMLPPTMKSGLPSYGFNEGYQQYHKDLNDDKLQEYMWSIYEGNVFDTQPDFSTWQTVDRLKIGYDPKEDMSTGTEVPPTMIYLQSESVKTKIVLEANGLNESLGHSYPDIEFSHRLRNLFDFKWIADNTNTTYKITGGHKIIDKMRLTEESEGSSKSIYDKYVAGSKDIPNTWNLSKIHEANQTSWI